jgi:hypothetical protein
MQTPPFKSILSHNSGTIKYNLVDNPIKSVYTNSNGCLPFKINWGGNVKGRRVRKMNDEELRHLTNAVNTLKERIALYRTVRTHGKEPEYENNLLKGVLEAVKYIGEGEWRDL